MVKMAAIAPKGVFEDEEVMTVSCREEPYERHYDDFSRNWEEAASRRTAAWAFSAVMAVP